METVHDLKIPFEEKHTVPCSQSGYYNHISQSLAWYDFFHMVDNGLQLPVSDFANFIYNPGPTITQVLFLAS